MSKFRPRALGGKSWVERKEVRIYPYVRKQAPPAAHGAPPTAHGAPPAAHGAFKGNIRVRGAPPSFGVPSCLIPSASANVILKHPDMKVLKALVLSGKSCGRQGLSELLGLGASSIPRSTNCSSGADMCEALVCFLHAFSSLLDLFLDRCRPDLVFFLRKPVLVPDVL